MSSEIPHQPDPDLKFHSEENNQQIPADPLAADLRGFGPLGILAILLILFIGNINIGPVFIPVGGILVLFWAKRSQTPWSKIGFVKPKNWIITIVSAIFFGVAFKIFMKAIVMPVFGADPVNQTYHYLAGNTPELPAAIWAMLVAGFGEETVFRGFMFERLEKLLGSGMTARILIVGISSALFALAHYANQGSPGVEQAAVTGLVFGTIFMKTGRIWFLIIAHAAFDLAALAIIYWNIESKIAHLIFK